MLMRRTNVWNNLLEVQMVKSFQKNGNIHVPKKIRQQLSSDDVKIYTTKLNDKTVIVLEPVGNDKKPTVVYE